MEQVNEWIDGAKERDTRQFRAREGDLAVRVEDDVKDRARKQWKRGNDPDERHPPREGVLRPHDMCG
jgi:hypothetical protein